jgi:2-alkenal reductase
VRPFAAALLAVVAAVLGGASVLALGRAGGWIEPSGAGGGETVVVETTVAAATTESTTPPAAAAPPLRGGFDPARIYAERSAGVVTIYANFDAGGQSQGTGFVVDRSGVILTNAHVITNAGEVPITDVRGADRLYIEFVDGDRVEGEVVGWDVFDDVGVVRVDPKDHALVALPLADSSQVRVGEPVAAIGSPFDNVNSLSVGVVSATKRGIPSLTSSYQLVDAIQTDAPINRGNSGGPLFDAAGRVIGINAQIRSASGNAEGVGFAVPINAARRSMEQLVETGRVAYAYVGITTADLTPSLARELGYDADFGAVVTSVTGNSPAAAAGFRAGGATETLLGLELPRGADVIVAIDGEAVRTAEDVVRIVSQALRPGQTARFTVDRDGRKISLPVRVAERPLVPEQG